METHHKMKQIRKDAGYSQEEMADLLKMSQSAYSHLESGHRSVKLSEISKIAKVLKKTEEEIMSQLSGCVVSTINNDSAQHNVGINISNNELIHELLSEKDKTIAAQQVTITAQSDTIAIQKTQIETLQAQLKRLER